MNIKLNSNKKTQKKSSIVEKYPVASDLKVSKMDSSNVNFVNKHESVTFFTHEMVEGNQIFKFLQKKRNSYGKMGSENSQDSAKDIEIKKAPIIGGDSMFANENFAQLDEDLNDEKNQKDEKKIEGFISKNDSTTKVNRKSSINIRNSITKGKTKSQK